MHWRKAKRFQEAANHDYGGGFWEATVSSAILSAIHLCDALAMFHLGIRSSSQDHDEAIDLVESISALAPEVRSRFARHVRALLDAKGLVQYSNAEYRETDAATAIRHLDRAFLTLDESARKAGWKT